jgi:hypothetical protein
VLLTSVLALAAPACRGCEPPSAAADAGSSVDAPFDRATGLGHPWPRLPSSEGEARALVDRYATRDAGVPPEETPLDIDIARSLLAALDSGDDREGGAVRVIAGMPAIRARVASEAGRSNATGRGFYLLWGTHHDAPAQVVAFRELTAARPEALFTHVVLEQLRADGRWASTDPAAQRGDDEAIRRWAGRGAAEARKEIAASQEREDYAAWKYDYLGAILDVVDDGRTSPHELAGCDMPRGLQERLGDIRLQWGDALRELHCALALADRIDPNARPGRIAMLWGEKHVAAGGVRRFLPTIADLLVIRAVGGRPPQVDDPIARTIAERLELVDPLLVEDTRHSASGAWFVVGPSRASPHFDRVRLRDGPASPEDAGGGSPTNTALSSAAPSVVRLDGRPVAVSSEPRTATLAPGPHTLVVPLPLAKRILVAGFDLPRRGGVAIRIEQTEPEVTVTVRAPD